MCFSIFTNPPAAWGQATGEVEVARPPKHRSDVTVPSVPAELLAWPIEVESVFEASDGLVQVMCNVLAKDAASAREVGVWLECELGLFPEAYWDDSP